jgi:hypothetical protein
MYPLIRKQNLLSTWLNKKHQVHLLKAQNGKGNNLRHQNGEQ